MKEHYRLTLSTKTDLWEISRRRFLRWRCYGVYVTYKEAVEDWKRLTRGKHGKDQ